MIEYERRCDLCKKIYYRQKKSAGLINWFQVEFGDKIHSQISRIDMKIRTKKFQLKLNGKFFRTRDSNKKKVIYSNMSTNRSYHLWMFNHFEHSNSNVFVCCCCCCAVMKKKISNLLKMSKVKKIFFVQKFN